MNKSFSDKRVARIVMLFETFQPMDIERLDDYYAADAQFKDPFNEVNGIPDIQAVFRHMFVALNEPRFTVHDVICEGDQCFLTWDFFFSFKRFSGATQIIRGSSHLKLDLHGKVSLHRDYWDAAEELYEKLPGLGLLMRGLKRRARA
jgi:ketosteroid isomerase-like protein